MTNSSRVPPPISAHCKPSIKDWRWDGLGTTTVMKQLHELHCITVSTPELWDSGLLNCDQYSGLGLDFRPDISYPIRQKVSAQIYNFLRSMIAIL